MRKAPNRANDTGAFKGNQTPRESTRCASFYSSAFSAKQARVRRQSAARSLFLGSENPRALRVLAALVVRPRSREEIDRIAGASNGPALIQDLRALGLPKRTCLPCERTPCYDRDGEVVHRGIYFLTPAGRRRVQAWLREREAARNSSSVAEPAGMPAALARKGGAA